MASTTIVSVRLPLEVAHTLSNLATNGERTLSDELRLAVERHVATDPAAPGVHVS